MYSIYDTYGMNNDLESRYNAAKSAGTPTASTKPSLNNSPFQPKEEVPINTPSLATQPVTNQQNSIYDNYQGVTDDAPFREGGEEAPGLVGRSKDFFGYSLGGPIYGGFKGIENTLNYATNPNYTGKQYLGDMIDTGIKSLPGYGLAKMGVEGVNSLANWASGKKGSVGSKFSDFIGFLTGSPSEAPSLGPEFSDPANMDAFGGQTGVNQSGWSSGSDASGTSYGGYGDGWGGWGGYGD
jgi:hypothetical protein